MQAFKAAESVGVPRLLDPVEIAECAVPDKLAVMTYVFQLKIHLGDSVDGLTTVSRYAKQGQEALGQLLMAGASRDDDAAFSSGTPSEDSDDNTSSDSEEYSSDSDGGEVVLVPKKWKVKGTELGQGAAESGEAMKEETQDAGNGVQTSTETQADSSKSKPAKTSASMYADLDDSSSGNNTPQVARKDGSKARKPDGADSDEQLEVFTASGDVIVKPADGGDDPEVS